MALHRPLLLLVLLAVSAGTATAQLRLVKDINVLRSPADSDPGFFASIGNVTFFFADLNSVGNELWKTDGTPGGTTLVRDIRPGGDSGVPDNRFGAPVAGNRIFFVASDGEHGQELWASDGTWNGTVMVADIAPGSATSNPTFGVAVGSILFFTATSPDSGTELWRTDGTPAGTRLVIDMRTGAAGSSPQILGQIGSTLLFRASNGTAVGIYATDGTAEGTTLVAATLAGVATSLTNASGAMVLFTVPDATRTSWTLMKTDGTSTGTVAVRMGFTEAPVSFNVTGGVAYFTGNDGITGPELWRTDGTADGTRLVADITPGPAGTNFHATVLAEGRLMLAVVAGDTSQLWTTDGTTSGTRLVKEVPGATTGAAGGGRYYFTWDDGVHGREWWSSDGTSEGTAIVADIAPGAADSVHLALVVSRPDGVLFRANDGQTGEEPWVSDGTPAGTHVARNLAPDFEEGSHPYGLKSIGGRLFFGASDGVRPLVWTSDGTTAGTVSLNAPFRAGGFVSGGLYYFVAGEPGEFAVWRTDGNPAGTFPLFPVGDAYLNMTLLPFRGGMFFIGNDAEHGPEPWFTDGTIGGTRIIADIEPGPQGSFRLGDEDGATVAGDIAFFAANRQPWRTDGTAAGTRSVLSTFSEDAEEPRAFTHVADWVYFASHQHDSAFNLWRTNIASGETMLVRRFEGVRAPPVMHDVGGTLLFLVSGELWRSDGTEAGTVKIADPVSSPSCFEREDFTVANGVLYWYAFDDFTPELWRSDGTTEGTFRLGRFEGPFAEVLQFCQPQPIHFNDGLLYFIGNDPVHGAEPWVSDGTVEGTRLLYDVNPGAAPSEPGWFLTMNGTLYFSAETRSTGQELWALPLGCGSHCQPRRRGVRH